MFAFNFQNTSFLIPRRLFTVEFLRDILILKSLFFPLLYAKVNYAKPKPKPNPSTAALKLKKKIKYPLSREKKLSIAMFFLAKNILEVKMPDSPTQEQIIEIGNQIQSSIPEEQKIALEVKLSNELYTLLFNSDEE